MASIIEIENLTKQFGNRTVIDGLSLTIEAGEIFGFVGPNGAGKTSTIRIMTTLLEPSGGDVRIGGYSVRKEARQIRRMMGYMPDVFGLYKDMTVWEYLDFFAACYHLPQRTRWGIINDLLELVDLGHRRDDMVNKLSRGMQQRLSLARTLVHDPQVLILDEPASGLDPRARIEIRELLVELAHMGKTIFFSTHILTDVAEICNQVGILEAGKLAAIGDLESLQQQLIPNRTIGITVLDGAERARSLLEKLPGVKKVEMMPESPNNQPRLDVEFSGNDETLSRVLTYLIKEGIAVVQFNVDNRNLEAVFMQATKGLVT